MAGGRPAPRNRPCAAGIGPRRSRGGRGARSLAMTLVTLSPKFQVVIPADVRAEPGRG